MQIAPLSFNDKIKFTSIGGLAIKLTNKTGVESVAGKLVQTSTATDDAVGLTGVNDTECIGVFLESGFVDGSETWIVMSGIAVVLFDDDHGPLHGDWVQASEAGYAHSQNSPAASPTHFLEIGHCLETVVAGGVGTHVAARCALHFL